MRWFRWAQEDIPLEAEAPMSEEEVKDQEAEKKVVDPKAQQPTDQSRAVPELVRRLKAPSVMPPQLIDKTMPLWRKQPEATDFWRGILDKLPQMRKLEPSLRGLPPVKMPSNEPIPEAAKKKNKPGPGNSAPRGRSPGNLAPGPSRAAGWLARQCRFAEDYFAPSEAKELHGTPQVRITGEQPVIFADIPGMKGHINVTATVSGVFEAMKSAFPADFFAPITDIRIASLPGRFGEARSVEPNTIYLDTNNIASVVHKAVEAEVAKAAAEGIEPEVTDEVAGRVNRKVVEQIWETIAHERAHDVDFQQRIKQYQEDIKAGKYRGTLSFGDVLESSAEQAGRNALRVVPRDV